MRPLRISPLHGADSRAFDCKPRGPGFDSPDRRVFFFIFFAIVNRIEPDQIIPERAVSSESTLFASVHVLKMIMTLLCHYTAIKYMPIDTHLDGVKIYMH